MVNKMKETWNQFFQRRGRFYILPHPELDKIVLKFGTYKVRKVLDLGCGSGRHSIALAKEGFSVTGIDFSKEALALAEKWAKKENLKVTFELGNINKRMKFKDASFEGILAIDSLHYDSTQALKFTLKEMARILKTNGLIFVTLPTQVDNPLVTHLIFTEQEIIELVSENFKIVNKFLDNRNYLCVFAVKQ
jgi:ubiquinone/menaquinone biosynthesis C-methylase UbiE